MNKEPKAWVIVGTKMGYMVSQYKMTRAEANELYYRSSIELDFKKELGFWHGENFITAMDWNPALTKKEAQRYCDQANKDEFNIFQEILDEVEEVD